MWSTSQGFVVYAEEGLALSRQFITHVRGKAMNKVVDDVVDAANQEPVRLRPPSTMVKSSGVAKLNNLLCKSGILFCLYLYGFLRQMRPS